MDTYIFFMMQIVVIYIGVKLNKSNSQAGNDIWFWPLISIITVFIEESIFRHGLKLLMVNIPYNIYMNALLFGLVHGSNYFITRDKQATLVQMCHTTYLGYYLLQFDVVTAYFIHMYYNVVNSIIFCLIMRYINVQIISDIITFINVDHNKRYFDDTSNHYKQFNNNLNMMVEINVSKLPEDIKLRRKQLSDVMDNHVPKYHVFNNVIPTNHELNDDTNTININSNVRHNDIYDNEVQTYKIIMSEMQ